MKRRHVMGLAVASGALAISGVARGQVPRQVRILVGVPAGAPGDILARAVADKLKASLGTNVIVENLPCASTQLAISAAVRSTPDGSTILLTPSSPLSLFPHTYSKLPYRPAEELVPLSLAGHFNHAFAVGPMVPESVKRLDEFLAWAKAHPDRASYGTSGTGTIPHLLAVVVAKTAGVALINVPYKGSGQGVTDLIGGQIAAMSSPIGNFLPHKRSGRVRLVAVSGEARSRLAPQVPTYQEQGFALVAREWLGFFAPAGMPEATVLKFNDALQGALEQAEVMASVSSLGIEVGSSTPDALAGMLRADGQEWQKLVRQIGFRADS
jgi:tripartite-type tricarboxylate transporter receptor subunit TctC